MIREGPATIFRAPAGPPPPLLEEEGGRGDGWVLLTTAKNQVVAHLIQGRLAGYGIDCVMDGFNPSPGAWLKPFGDPLAPVKIYVKRHDLASASMMLHEVGHQPPDPVSEGPATVGTAWRLTVAAIVILTIILLAQMFGTVPGLDGPL